MSRDPEARVIRTLLGCIAFGMMLGGLVIALGGFVVFGCAVIIVGMVVGFTWCTSPWWLGS